MSGAHRNGRAIALLRRWLAVGDAAEQRDTLDALRSGLAESHSSERNPFGPGLHETHVCRDCGAAITIPYAKAIDAAASERGR